MAEAKPIAQQSVQASMDKRPRPHILWLFLQPDDLGERRISSQDLIDFLGGPGVELLDPNDGHSMWVERWRIALLTGHNGFRRLAGQALVPTSQGFVRHLARTQHNPLHSLHIGHAGVVDDSVERTFGQLFN